MSEKTKITPPVFAHTSTGILVAAIGDHAYALIPARLGLHLSFGHGIGPPMHDWRADDFYGFSGRLADETAFRDAVHERYRHYVDREALGRRTERVRASTPWGMAQTTTIFAPGIREHKTASHGGFELDFEQNQKVPEPMRTGGWYEEDSGWAAVALAFPDLFTAHERKLAEAEIRRQQPDWWEAVYRGSQNPHQRREQDERREP